MKPNSKLKNGKMKDEFTMTNFPANALIPSLHRGAFKPFGKQPEVVNQGSLVG